jgi:hypothetical protein
MSDPDALVILRDDDPSSPTYGTEHVMTEADLERLNMMLGHLVAGRLHSA